MTHGLGRHKASASVFFSTFMKASSSREWNLPHILQLTIPCRYALLLSASLLVVRIPVSKTSLVEGQRIITLNNTAILKRLQHKTIGWKSRNHEQYIGAPAILHGKTRFRCEHRTGPYRFQVQFCRGLTRGVERETGIEPETSSLGK
jgi:hypothetical protein